MAVEERNVRRRLNEATGVLYSLSIECSAMEVSQICNRCVKSHEQESNGVSAIPPQSHTVLQSFLDGILIRLVEWGKSGMQVFCSLSQKRRDRWPTYPNQEKWMYYATELLNEGIRWSTETIASSFIGGVSALPIATSNHGHVTCLAILAQRWNSTAATAGLAPIELVIFASLELWWFGYKQDGNESVTVHMTFDESEAGGRLVVNRLESSEELNDFKSIVFHNTLLGGSDSVQSQLAELNIDSLSYLLVMGLVQELLQDQQRQSSSRSDTEGLRTTALMTDLWHCVQYMRSFPSTPALEPLFLSTVGSVLGAGGQPPPGVTIPCATALEAFSAALRLNESNYLVRRQLIECYLDIGEQYLAHQHCLYLLEQLAPHVSGECVEAPIAVVTHDFAAELLDTTLQDVHQLHLRGEEGYERLATIPGVGSRLDVEWLLDDQLALYPGVVAVHPDGRGLCISYADDVEPGQHRRRFENALHLVNINDPQDQYLENYTQVDRAQDGEETEGE